MMLRYMKKSNRLMEKCISESESKWQHHKNTHKNTYKRTQIPQITRKMMIAMYAKTGRDCAVNVVSTVW